MTGAELLVAAHADQQLALVRHPLLDEHALVDPPAARSTMR